MTTNANWFVALPVAAGALPPDLLANLPTGLRRLHPEDLHVTVAFLGPVGADPAFAAWDCLQGSTERPFEVATNGLALFGRPARPSALGLEFSGDRPELVEFIARWRNLLRAAVGVAAETRSVRPHITLARLPRRADPVVKARAKEHLDTERPKPVLLRLDTIALFTSADDRRVRLFQRVRERSLPFASPLPDI